MDKEMTTPHISIIVPIYNAGQYLHRCIDSLLRQGLKVDEYEIILVNDGSPDDSLSICESYQNKSPQIKIISQANAGVAAARNSGLANATGEFICFVDADDYLIEGGLAYILEHYASKYECDIIRYFCTIVYQQTEVSNDVSGKITFQGSGHEFIEKFGLDTFCYCFLYKRHFLIRNNIWYSPYIIGEDFKFVSTVLLANPRILSTSSNIYRYIIHKQSATTTRNVIHARKCVEHHIAANKDILNNLKEKQIDKNHPIYIPTLKSIQEKMVLIFSRILSSKFSHKEYKQIIEDCKVHGFLPIRLQTNSNKLRLCYWLINFTMQFFIVYRINCYFYNNLFVPYILPKLNRDK